MLLLTADNIKKELGQHLNPGERMITVARLHAGSIFAYHLRVQLTAQLGLLGALLSGMLPEIPSYAGGVTDQQRLILVPFANTTVRAKNLRHDQAYAISLSTIQLQGDRIHFRLPNKPQVENLRVLSLSKMLTGLDASEFLAAIKKR